MNLFNLISLVVLVVSGCGATTWSGPQGRGSRSISGRSYQADSAMNECLSNRRVQRRELLCEAGIVTGRLCGTQTAPTATTAEATVSVRDQVQDFCTRAEQTAAEGGISAEVASATRAYCAERLGPNGIPAEATSEIRVEVPPPTTEVPPPTDPRLQILVASNPALFQDDHAFCVAITSDYGTPNTAGGVAPMAGNGYGTPGVVPGLSVGFLGRTASIPIGGGYAPMGAGGYGVAPTVGGGYGGTTPISIAFTLPRDISVIARIVSEDGVMLSRRPVEVVGTGTGRVEVVRPRMGDTVILQWRCSNGREGNRLRTLDNFFSIGPRDCGLSPY